MAAHSQWSLWRHLPAGRSAAGRLRILASLEDDLAETDVLLAALQHAVADLGGWAAWCICGVRDRMPALGCG